MDDEIILAFWIACFFLYSIALYRYGYCIGYVHGVSWMKETTWKQFGWKDE